jgi:hypothetical protein
VRRAKEEGAENEKIERSLKQLNTRKIALRHCVESLRYVA